ncbi:hypothetical protein V5799_013692 [Amblyomma americanum]|uniref:Uncharacterized protein n=1 Tax=Amblyomma americanum TaxID=6943 RepID=A0AAQ4E584_AMBAM
MACVRYFQRRVRSKDLKLAAYFTLHREICEQVLITSNKPPQQILLALQAELAIPEHGSFHARLQVLDRLSVSFCPSEELYQEALNILLGMHQKLQYQSHLNSSVDITDGSDSSHPEAIMKMLVQYDGIEVTKLSLRCEKAFFVLQKGVQQAGTA